MKYLTLSLLLVSLCSIGAGHSTIKTESHSTNVMTTADGTIDAAVFEDSVQSLYSAVGLDKQGLSFEAFRYGMMGYYTFLRQGKLNDAQLVSIIDFTKPSTVKRFFTIDLTNRTVKFNTYVSHGKNTGENMATSFSNLVHSNQSSLGFYITGETYVGGKGYSLRLDGMDKGYNDNMRARAVVMHEADYVSENWIQRYGRLGRSQGCPALPKEISREVIDVIKNKTLIFAFFKDDAYLTSSAYLDLPTILSQFDAGKIASN